MVSFYVANPTTFLFHENYDVMNECTLSSMVRQYSGGNGHPRAVAAAAAAAGVAAEDGGAA